MDDCVSHQEPIQPSEGGRAVRPLAHVDIGAGLCVLASGSSGNCTALLIKRGSSRRVILLDLGLSPRRTFKLLGELGLGPHPQHLIDAAIVTHLDADHFQPTWLRALPPHARLLMHDRHADELRRAAWTGPGSDRVHGFTNPFELDSGVTCSPVLMSHDDQGVAALRFDMPGLIDASDHSADRRGPTLGFATDLGHVPRELVAHFCGEAGARRPDVLAIESNYCVRMQLASNRPDFLKTRIMGGSGHLSNDEALRAIDAIAPREHVVLLHLSRECNDPALVAALHRHRPYDLTISSQFSPTPWIHIRAVPEAASRMRPVVIPMPSRAPRAQLRPEFTGNLFTSLLATAPKPSSAPLA